MIPYMGGKSRIAGWIVSNFPADYERMSYCEVFGGGGWVLFKKERSDLETYNDLNSHLVNLFKIIRDNYEEFRHKAEWSLHSREMYFEARKKLQDDVFLNDIEKAITYAIDRVQAFSGGKSGWGYLVTADKLFNGKWLPFVKRLEAVNARLKSVQIECLDFEKLIDKYDNKNALFYLDPPYYNAEFYYNRFNVLFEKSDHKRLADILKLIKGKYILSYYDNEHIRKLYKGKRIISKETSIHALGCTRQSANRTKPKATELLIMNY